VRDVLVVGAGIAGLTFARAHGGDVLVLDKGRGPGGRASRRRIDGHVFHHGAPPDPRWVPRELAEGLDVRCGVRVERLERAGSAIAAVADGLRVEARRVVVTAPAPQAAELVAPLAPALAARAAATRWEEVVASMGFGEPPPGAVEQPGEPRRWVAHRPVEGALQQHRWRFARVAEPAGVPFLAEGDVALCGDWLLGRTLDDAAASGRALALS
jgi:renalase